MNPIDEALVSALSGSPGVTAPGGVWQDVAPLATSATHVIFSLSAGLDAPQMNGTAWEDRHYLVKAVATTKAAADAAADQIRTFLDGASLTVTGYSTLDVRREEPVSYVEVDGDKRWYHSGGLYLVKVCR